MKVDCAVAQAFFKEGATTVFAYRRMHLGDNV